MRSVMTLEVAPMEAEQPKATDEIKTVEPVKDLPAVDNDKPQTIDAEIALLNSIYKSVVDTICLRKKLEVVEDKLEAIEKEAAETRDAYRSSETETRRLVESLPAHLLRIRDGINAELPETETDSDEEDDPPALAAKSASNENWQTIETVTITKDVPGLGAKKIEALCDEYPTLGDLEKARVEAATESKHFANVLPKGIGKTSADELESRLLIAQTGSGGKIVVEPRVEQASLIPSEVAVEPKADESDETNMQFVEDGRTEDPKHIQWARAMAASLEANGTEESLSEPDDPAWLEGRIVYKAGTPVSYCPRRQDGKITTNPDSTQIKWLKGYVWAKLNDQNPEADESQASEPEILEPETIDPEAIDPPAEVDAEDQIAHFEKIAERIRQSGDLKAKADTESWNKGYEAAIDEQPLENCPLSLTQSSQTDWIRGWVEASEMSGGL